MNIPARSLASLAFFALAIIHVGPAAAEDTPPVMAAEPAPAAPAQTTVMVAPATAEPVAAPVAPVEPIWTHRFRIGAEVALAIPLNEWADYAAVALGGHVRFAWDPHPNVGITARVGYLHGIGGDGYDFGMLPFMVGGEYRFLDGGITPFVGAELGGTIGWVTTNTGFGTASDSDGAFALSAGGGVRFGRFDVRADIYAPDVDDLFGIRVAIGGDFAVF